MQNISDTLIVALDVDTLEKAKHFVNILYPTVKFFKIGNQLFTACGPEAVRMVGEKGGHVFLDLKFNDIPNTVRSAVASCTGLNGVFMMTVNTETDSGIDMLKKAVEGATIKAKELNIPKPLLVGVTVLTSRDNDKDVSGIVLKRAGLAKEAGLDGVVCSVLEAAAVRKACGKAFIIVTPGIRPKGASLGDQKRVATAAEAIAAGANYIVVGRPILEAQDPLKVVQDIFQEFYKS